MDNWKRAITVLGKLETAGVRLSQLMRVMNPVEAKRAAKVLKGHADITSHDLDVIETALSNLDTGVEVMVKPRTDTKALWRS